jgi:hypothetical protein
MAERLSGRSGWGDASVKGGKLPFAASAVFMCRYWHCRGQIAKNEELEGIFLGAVEFIRASTVILVRATDGRIRQARALCRRPSNGCHRHYA